MSTKAKISSSTGTTSKTKSVSPEVSLASCIPMELIDENTINSDPNSPFRILKSDIKGRYLETAKDLKQGELILEDEPIVTGPQRGSPPICLSCYGEVDGTYLCPLCGWPLCGAECAKSPRHIPECKMTQLGGTKIHHIAGVLDVNGFEIRMPEQNIMGLYQRGCLPEHNCVANTHRVFNSEFTLSLRAAHNIKKGKPISITYTDPMWPTTDRRAQLSYSKYIDCNCNRCLDPTELGAYLNGLHCHECSAPALVPSDPFDPEKDWQCKQCKAKVISQYATKLIVEAAEALRELESEAEDPSDYEKFIDEYSGLIHPTQTHFVDAKSSLVHMYGAAEGYGLEQMTTAQLNRKEELARELLTLCKKIMPGISRFRGTIVYELAKTLIQKTKTEYDVHESVTSDRMQKLIKDATDALTETVQILQYEPLYQSEGETCKEAKELLSDFQEWVRNIT